MRHYRLPPLHQLEAFEASARHLSFTRAADELSLTQSAVSRQIAALEAYYEVPLFRRLHRALRLTEDGERLFAVVCEVLFQLQEVGTRLAGQRAKTVVVTTTPGFAGLWLIPRLARFAALQPDVDVRVRANHDVVDMERDGVDLAIRYGDTTQAAASALLCFKEVAFPVCSPLLMRDGSRPLKMPLDLRHHTLLQKETESIGSFHHWSTWLGAMGLGDLQPRNTLQFSLYDQMIQAAIDGQGIALGHSPLVDDLLRQGRLAMPFDAALASPRGYVMLASASGLDKSEVTQFVAWLRGEALCDAQPVASMAAVI
jgi:LysR family glycine cleavage system transcriptional activator